MKKILITISLIVMSVLTYAQEIKRQYTVQEIDDLRKACELRYLYGTTYIAPPKQEEGQGWNNGFSSSSLMSRPYHEDEKVKTVEQMVPTYMLAGIIADSIYSEDKRTSH